MRVILILDVDVKMSVGTISDAYVVLLARMWMFVASSFFVVVCVYFVRMIPVRVLCLCVCMYVRERDVR